MTRPASRQHLPAVLWPLMFGNVVIGMGVMVVAGLLNEIRSGLEVSITTAGHLISASALLVCLGAPLLAMLVARWDRRRLLVGSLLWYALFHALAALAPGFDALLTSRVLAMVSAAVFTPQAAACIGQLVPEHQRGRGITFVFLGWSVASVLGMPLGAWIGGTLGWRWSMGLIAALSVVGALWLWRRMPDGVVGWAQANLSSGWSVILLMNLLMLVCGMFIDLPAAVLLLTPVFVPLANSIGMDLTQLGIMMTVNLAIGLYTPPVGTTLFITSSLAKVKVGETVRELGPFYFVAFGVLLLVSYVPAAIFK